MMVKVTIVDIILCGLITQVCAAAVADLVLSCSLAKDRPSLEGRLGGSGVSWSPALLILLGVEVDEDMETVTPFVPPATPDPAVVMFESAASSLDLPNLGLLLHADCNEQEVECEISRYADDSDFFIAVVSVADAGFSTALVLQTVAMETDESTPIQKELRLPLSQSGTLLTKVVFVMFSDKTSVAAPPGGHAHLSCGFRQQELAPGQEVTVEWRQQHRGSGRPVLNMKTTPNDVEGSTEVLDHRGRCSVDAVQVAGEGDASLTLQGLEVRDEGTYICTVKVGHMAAQQVVHLQILQAPTVSLQVSPGSPQTLSCLCSNFFPLDLEIEWSSVSPGSSEPTVLTEQGFLTGHRRHGDGTFSQSSHITVGTTVPAGTRLVCTVSHPALDVPLTASLLLEGPPKSYFLPALVLLLVTGVFILQLFWFSSGPRQTS